MTTYQIPHELEYHSYKFPREALQEVIANQEKHTPELLKVLEYTIENFEDLVVDYDYMAHMYTLYLLAQFREKRAYPLIVKLFSTPNDAIGDFTGDLITEDLSRILASVYDGDDGPIKNMIESDHIDEFVRSAALDSLAILYLHGEMTRDEIYGYLKSLFEKLPRHEHYIWTALVSVCVDLYPDVLSICSPIMQRNRQ